MSDLQNLSEETKAKIVDEVNAEVTSIAKEEERTGQKINIPSAEKLVSVMSAELIRCQNAISVLLPTMSKKDIHRATMAYLSLPTGDIPVFLKSEASKKLFAYGQRAIMARMVVIQHEANKLALEARAKKQQEEQEKANVAATEPTPEG